MSPIESLEAALDEADARAMMWQRRAEHWQARCQELERALMEVEADMYELESDLTKLDASSRADEWAKVVWLGDGT